MKRALSLLLFLFTPLAFAQSGPVSQYVQFTASKIQDSAGNLMQSGTITFTPQTSSGASIFPTATSGGRIVPSKVQWTIGNGTVTTTFGNLQLVDVSQAFPINFCYVVSIHDNVWGNTYTVDSCMQPSWNAAWCTYSATSTPTTTCNFDNYVSPGAPGVLTVAGPPGINWRGAWSSSNTYALNDGVSFNGSSYISLISGNTSTPGSASWSLLAAQGSVGPTGNTGATGPAGGAISVATSNSWLALQAFNAGMSATKGSFTQASPSTAAGFSNFGSTFSQTSLGGGVTVMDNGSTFSFGVAQMFQGSHFTTGLYGNNSTSQSNVALCPTATAAPYPSVQSSFGNSGVCAIISEFNQTLFTQPFIFNGSAPTNPGGWSSFGRSLIPSASALGGGAEFMGNGSHYSYGITALSTSGLFSTAIYATNDGSEADVVFCPSFQQPYPTIGVGAATAPSGGFGCPTKSTYQSFSSTVPFIHAPSSIASPANWSQFAANLIPSASAFGGGWSVLGDGATYVYGATPVAWTNGGYALALFGSNTGKASGIVFCPSAAGNAYPLAPSAITPLCNVDFESTGATFMSSPVLPDPVNANHAANKLYVDLSAQRNSAPPKYVVKYGLTMDSFGDSITAGVGAVNSNPSTSGYANDLATSAGYTLTNHGIKGDMACDMVDHLFNSAPGQFNTSMIGANDSAVKGVGAYEAVYQSCHNAFISFLGVGSSGRTAASSCTQTSGTWTPDTTYSAVTGVQSTTNGSVLTCPIATTGGPIYVWYRITDGNSGTFTYSLNGGAAVSVNAFTTPAIATGNGATTAVGYIRIPPPPKGTQTVVFTVTSATGAGNDVSIIGLGTPPSNVYYTAPVLLVNSVTPANNNGYGLPQAQYSLDAIKDAMQHKADGLDVRPIDVRPALQDDLASLTFDGLHPNLAGHAAIAALMLPIATDVPAASVLRGTPTSLTQKCTPNDTWTDGTHLYYCVTSGQITQLL
jgi:lysophospholipase L1-like esterase